VVTDRCPKIELLRLGVAKPGVAKLGAADCGP
jgi:hypothetical protein